jgi:Domain of unknown function (DUF5658)
MTQVSVLCVALMTVVPAAAFAADPPPVNRPVVTATVVYEPSPAPVRPLALPALYAASAVLQAYDGYSTLAGLRAGAVERNPLMSPMAEHPALLLATKVATAAATIGMAEQMWRDHHPGRAVALMIVSNGLMAAVDWHNSRVLSGAR